jgi:nucleotide-binding universal stress UspA family protein
MLNNLLVPTDGSKLPQKGVQHAVPLAKLTGAKLVAHDLDLGQQADGFSLLGQ